MGKLNAKDLLNKGMNAAKAGAEKVQKDIAPKVAKGASDTAKKASEFAKNGGTVVMNGANQAKDAVMKQLDVNGDGSIDINDIIILALKVPGIRIDRETFLRSEFKLHYDQTVVDEAIRTTPLNAGISSEDIEKIADDVIQQERYCVSGISAALGTPGGTAMVATIPADITQYYGYTLRAAQKLMYLYGFPQIINNDGDAEIDSSTMNILIVALGCMFGVAGANNFIKAMAKGLSVGVEKQLMKTALTKGTIYPLVKSIAKWFGAKMTKEVFSGFFKKAIPVVGGVVGGGITYVSFKPCCDRLRNSLKDTKLSNASHVETKEEKEIFDAIISEVETDDDTTNENALLN